MNTVSTQQPGAISALILKIVESVLGRTVPDENTNLVGLGASSMELIRIINRLEDETGFRPDFENVSVDPTLASLTAAVQEWGALRDARKLDAVAADGKHHDVACQASAASTFRLEEAPANAPARPRSVRDFADIPVTRELLSYLLGALRIESENGEPKARYASAGGLFPVQVYLYAKPDRIAGLPPGLFHYQAAQHWLRQVAPDVRIGTDSYEPVVNRPVFARAAFGIFLISQPAAAAAKYGRHASTYCLLEAGGMAQVLRDEAARSGLGLCAIGEFPFELWRDRFGVAPDQQYLYSFLGGADPGAALEPTLEDVMKRFRVV